MDEWIILKRWKERMRWMDGGRGGQRGDGSSVRGNSCKDFRRGMMGWSERRQITAGEEKTRVMQLKWETLSFKKLVIKRWGVGGWRSARSQKRSCFACFSRWADLTEQIKSVLRAEAAVLREPTSEFSWTRLKGISSISCANAANWSACKQTTS